MYINYLNNECTCTLYYIYLIQMIKVWYIKISNSSVQTIVNKALWPHYLLSLVAVGHTGKKITSGKKTLVKTSGNEQAVTADVKLTFNLLTPKFIKGSTIP